MFAAAGPSGSPIGLPKPEPGIVPNLQRAGWSALNCRADVMPFGPISFDGDLRPSIPNDLSDTSDHKNADDDRPTKPPTYADVLRQQAKRLQQLADIQTRRDFRFLDDWPRRWIVKPPLPVLNNKRRWIGKPTSTVLNKN